MSAGSWRLTVRGHRTSRMTIWVGLLVPNSRSTKFKRLDQMLEELEGGTLYMNMAWKPRAQQS